MKGTSLIAAMVAATLLCACARLPPPGAPTTRVSADYDATGDVDGVRAFVYGKRTELAFPRRPVRLTVHDENGVAVPYQREGSYYRLSRKLDRFTVWANTRVLSFRPVTGRVALVTAAMPESAGRVPLSTQPREEAPSARSPVTVSMEPGREDDATALLRLFAAQQDQVRRAIAGAISTAETRFLQGRLERVKHRFNSAAAVMIGVRFDTGATSFSVDDRVAQTLVAAAKAAERINLRGRTDARIAGTDDPRIARGRALAARQFFIRHGIDAAKIRVFAQSAGDFIAPAGTEEGRALNRRVDIEFVDPRYATLQQADSLHVTAP
ncbi:OmpA family protein [Massilia sp. H6]|uniref:OmpA family protein n=1 Tax=Massilia sp. H6 TaxID=2970464 RepID=UPI002167F523|nr:OmpA family protein [Massilia sp. H6]UVW30692.1 hypothetical protein NRS07_20240 [Massilia sp. H6]